MNLCSRKQATSESFWKHFSLIRDFHLEKATPMLTLVFCRRRSRFRFTSWSLRLFSDDESGSAACSWAEQYVWSSICGHEAVRPVPTPSPSPRPTLPLPPALQRLLLVDGALPPPTGRRASTCNTQSLSNKTEYHRRVDLFPIIH